jgi:hypothetical protein
VFDVFRSNIKNNFKKIKKYINLMCFEKKKQFEKQPQPHSQTYSIGLRFVMGGTILKKMLKKKTKSAGIFLW